MEVDDLSINYRQVVYYPIFYCQPLQWYDDGCIYNFISIFMIYILFFRTFILDSIYILYLLISGARLFFIEKIIT